MTADPDAYRADSRDAWERAAEGWAARRAELQQAAAGVSAWMLDAVAPQPGQTILELACGPADTGLMAAELVRPGGKAILTDGAEAMVAIARARAEELGLADVVEARAMEAEWIDLAAASVDGVLCRWGYMLLVDPEAALRETRRVLRPDGRVALACWAAREENPWSLVPARLLADRGLAPVADPGEPGPFALADPARIEDLLYTAGFSEVVLDTVEVSFDYPSLDALFDYLRDCSPTFKAALPKLSPAEHTRFRDDLDAALAPWVRDGGRVVLPGRTNVAAATA